MTPAALAQYTWTRVRLGDDSLPLTIGAYKMHAMYFFLFGAMRRIAKGDRRACVRRAWLHHAGRDGYSHSSAGRTFLSPAIAFTLTAQTPDRRA